MGTDVGNRSIDMIKQDKQLNAGVVDVLYAVALGEGFFSSMHQLKARILSGDFEIFGTGGQGLYRVLLGFLIIVLSWVHYRRFALFTDAYPHWEFSTDIVVMILYMTLFLFVDVPGAYYLVVAVIWLLYIVSRAALWRKNLRLTVIEFSFLPFFIAVAVSSLYFTSTGSEWIRLLLVTAGAVLFRYLDQKYQSMTQV